MRRILLIVFILISNLTADEAHEIIKKLDENFRGKNIYLKLGMKVVSMGHERRIKILSYSHGTKKSFVRIIYPPKDDGITFLSLDNQMWQYVPKIERIIRYRPP